METLAGECGRPLPDVAGVRPTQLFARYCARPNPLHCRSSVQPTRASCWTDTVELQRRRNADVDRVNSEEMAVRAMHVAKFTVAYRSPSNSVFMH